MGLIAPYGSLSAFEKLPSECIAGENATELLGGRIEDYMMRNCVRSYVRAICIGFPATVSKDKTTVLNAPNVTGFDGVPVGTLLEKRFGIPVYIEKDVNLLLIGDLNALGCAAANVVACYIGTGIGNAIMIDGKLLSGANGVAGELGHIPFGEYTGVCGCGNIGCAEPLAGGRCLAKLRDEKFSESGISELFVNHADHPLLCEYTERLARVIAAEVNIIDPEILLLGGGVIEMQAFPKERLEAQIFAHVRRPLPHDNLKIIYSPTGGGTNGVVGAGILAWRKLK